MHKKSFWSQKFTFKTRINGQENFFFDFIPYFSLVLVPVQNTKSRKIESDRIFLPRLYYRQMS
jgi:hypothetical protein